MKSSRAEEFAKKARELEKEGLEIEVIGRGDRHLELRRKIALGQRLRRLALSSAGRKILISLIEAPEFKRGRVSFGIVCEMPVGKPGMHLPKDAVARLEEFLEEALVQSLKQTAKPGTAHRKTHRRA